MIVNCHRSQAIARLAATICALVSLTASSQTAAPWAKPTREQSLSDNCAPAPALAHAAPKIIINPFDRTKVLDSLYVATYEPKAAAPWHGSVQKFQLQDHTSGDTNSTAGQNRLTRVTSIWQQNNINTGVRKETSKDSGPKERIQNRERVVFSYLGESTHPSSAIPLSAHRIDLTLTNTGRETSATNNPAMRLGHSNEYQRLGGSPYSQPTVVIYGRNGNNAADRLRDSVLFVVTNRGHLHALDTNSGEELWTYVPQELINHLQERDEIGSSTIQSPTLNSDIRVLRYDVNADGIIDPTDNDRVIIYFNQGRGGGNYYALDVTESDNPKFLWSLNSDIDLFGLVSEAWSNPSIGRVLISDGQRQNSQKLVLIFGGGYDDSRGGAYSNLKSKLRGNAIFIVDAMKGTVLWHQTQAARGAFADMIHPIPGDITILDTNGDGWTDRMYAGDTAGQVWRFDITNGTSGNIVTGDEPNSLVTGGVIAKLGKTASTSPEDNRRFFTAPDISKMVNRRSSNYFNIAIGSGDLANPAVKASTKDRFYSLRDYSLEPLSQKAYDTYSPVVDKNDSLLFEIDGISSITSDKISGWKLSLGPNERVLASSITIDGTVMFTTYINNVETPCEALSKTNARAYSVELSNGSKRFQTLFEPFVADGLPSSVMAINTRSVVGVARMPAERSHSSGICLVGLVTLDRCVSFGNRTKTTWIHAESVP
jgi:type IV pilus assembly protein PilY1